MKITFQNVHNGERTKTELVIIPNNAHVIQESSSNLLNYGELSRGSVNGFLLRDKAFLSTFSTIKIMAADQPCIHLEILMQFLKDNVNPNQHIFLVSTGSKIPREMLHRYEIFFGNHGKVNGKKCDTPIKFKHDQNLPMLLLLFLSCGFNFKSLIFPPERTNILKVTKFLFNHNLIELRNNEAQLTHDGKLMAEMPYWLRFEHAMRLIRGEREDEIIEKLNQRGIPDWKIRRVQNCIPRQRRLMA